MKDFMGNRANQVVRTVKDVQEYAQEWAKKAIEFMRANPGYEGDYFDLWTDTAYLQPAYGTPEFEDLFEDMGYPRWDDDDIPREMWATSGVFEAGYREYARNHLMDLGVKDDDPRLY